MSKNNEGSSKEEKSNNDDLPMAIQIFLWRQTRFQKKTFTFSFDFGLIGSIAFLPFFVVKPLK